MGAGEHRVTLLPDGRRLVQWWDEDSGSTGHAILAPDTEQLVRAAVDPLDAIRGHLQWLMHYRWLARGR